MSSTITVLLIELGAITLACVACYVLATRLVRVVPGLRSTNRPPIVRTVRRSVLAAWAALALLVLAYNGWLLWRGIPPREHMLELLRSRGPDVFRALGIAVAKLAVAAIVVVLLTRGARQLLQRAEGAINRWDKIKDNDQSLHRFFGGLALVRSMGVIVDTLDGVSHRFASDRDWLRYYDHLRPLVPTFRAGLEYVVWIAMAALVLAQFETLRHFSAWGHGSSRRSGSSSWAGRSSNWATSRSATGCCPRPV